MINATPNIPVPVFSQSGPGIKAATPDLFVSEKVDDPGILENLLFESVAGHELLSLSRHDTVNGKNVIYRPIKNLSALSIQYSPQNLLSLQNPSNAYFNNFPIKFEERVPDGNEDDIVYVDQQTGDLIINVINMEPDEQIEVQVLTSGEVLDGTID